MKAIVYSRYGDPSALALREVAVPVPRAGQVLIKVRATSVNASDWETLSGKPLYARVHGLFRPRHPILGSDMAGEVERIGPGVRHLRVGDAVLGNAMMSMGGFAQYACLAESATVVKPANVSYADAATLPQAAAVALQCIETRGRLSANSKMLINGAGGAVGSFATQLARASACQITAVDAGSKRALLIALGATRTVDYEREDFVADGVKYDFILDVVGNRSIADLRRALAPNGTYSIVGGRITAALVLGAWVTLTSQQRMGVFAWRPKQPELARLAALVGAGELIPILHRCYTLAETPEALRAIGEHRTQGLGVVVQD